MKNLKDVASNLKRVMNSLHGWSRKHIGYLPRKLEYAPKRLNVLFKRNDKVAAEERKKILVDMDELLLREEIMWKQRSRLDTMKEGDANTNYFKRKACWRAKKNYISALKRNDGSSRTI